ncbi:MULTISPECIES: hypothetical protein [unclassified Mesorhizobium]|uniref:hypothetical protein n=1 Tax=unclassified Mesorhizobium TaxID=325217 RepID=UPI000A5ECE60|nr:MULTISPECIES: hypothetical protein [unclassified Mesorhizobium]
MNSKNRSTADFVALILSGLATLAVVAWMLLLARRGIDITDEGFYLNWIAAPGTYPVSVTLFGFVYHPIYRLLGGDIVLLRQANIVLTFGFAWVFCAALLFRHPVRPDAMPAWVRTIITAAMAAGSFSFFYYWLVTPSYNGLTLQAVTIVAAGIVLADRQPSRVSVAGWATIGIGGALAFLAKPSTAAALAVLVALYIPAAGKFNVRMASVSVLTAALLLLIASLLIDGSPQGTYWRLKAGLTSFDALGSGQAQTLFRWEKFGLAPKAKIGFAIGTLTTFVGVCLCASRNRAVIILGFLVPAAVAMFELALIFGLWLPNIRPADFDAKIMLSIPLGAAVACLVLIRGEIFSKAVVRRLALSIALLMLPYAFVFGTADNYWSRSVAAGLFWVASVVPLLLLVVERVGSWRPLLPVAMLCQLVAFLAAYAASEAPYRQPQPLRLNTQVTNVGGSKLLLEDGFARYFNETTKLIEHAGFTAGTPMIDLTGHSPTVLYTIGAKPIGEAWIIGGYPGSDRVAEEAVARVPCTEREAAWLLVEPGGPRSISAAVIHHFGMNVDTDYEVVGEITTPAGNGSYGQKPRLQRILKPTEVNNSHCPSKR